MNGSVKSGLLSEFEREAAYDAFIAGWTKYWNEVLRPVESLEPNMVKALIASESSFDPSASNRKRGSQRARGLMQVTDGSVRLLSNRSKELKDHFVNLAEDDMLDPNLSICAGIRWLFRKKEILEASSRHSADWRSVVASFKSVRPENSRLMGKFDRLYGRLQSKGG